MKHIIIAVLLAFPAGQSWSGSLTPPGPPAPTMKPLDDIEPRRPIRLADLPLSINSSGSFYLAENINFATPGVVAISVNAPVVTIDLNGFTLSGPGSNTGASGFGISVNAADKLVVKNGTIQNWRGNAIFAFPALDCTIDNVTVQRNGQHGIFLTTGTITNSTVIRNGDNGILQVNGSAIVKNSICSDNRLTGISSSKGNIIIEDNICNGNGAGGILASEASGRIIGNTCTGNNDGLLLEGSQSYVDGNSVYNNTMNGIRSYTFIFKDDHSVAVRNTAAGNGTNYSFSTTTKSGPIVTTNGVISSTNPWANFVH